MSDSGPTRAIVLSGGGARGAYEAGVLRYILDAVRPEVGGTLDVDIISGTSVGAINCTWLAATLDEPTFGARRSWYLWRTLEFSEIVKPAYGEIWRLARQFAGNVDWLNAVLPEAERPGDRRNGLLDPEWFENLIEEEIPFDRIRRNLDRGLLKAVTVSTTDIVSGRTTVFAQTGSGELPPWTRDPRRVAVGGPMTPDKVLASAAIPLMFPPVQIGERWFCDGGLRQNTPLTPALRLGADRVLVITLHAESNLPEPSAAPLEPPEPAPDAHSPNYQFILGKLLDALLLDPLDYDLMVLERINALLKRAGQLVDDYDFVEDAKEELDRMTEVYRGMSYRVVEPLLLRPSQDLGQLASTFAANVSDDFWGSRLMATVCKNAAERSGYGESDLLSYLLFDGGYTGQLLQLGYQDAAEKHDELVAFFEDD